MDEKPFLEVNILDIKENQVIELKKFHKSTFNIEEIFDTASELKYSNELKNTFSQELQNPSDDFVRFFLTNVYSGVKTQSVIEKFRPIIKKSLNQFVSEMMNDKIKSALNAESEENSSQQEIEALEESKSNETQTKIATTQEELESYFIVKNMLKELVPISDIVFKDTESYFGVLYKNNVRKWICRIFITATQKMIFIPDENKKEIRYPLETIYDIEKYKNELSEVLKRYIQQ